MKKSRRSGAWIKHTSSWDCADFDESFTKTERLLCGMDLSSPWSSWFDKYILEVPLGEDGIALAEEEEHLVGFYWLLLGKTVLITNFVRLKPDARGSRELGIEAK